MASTINVGILRALLTADTAEFDKARKRASDAAGTVSKSWASMGKQATQLGMSLTKTLTLPIIGIGGASVKAFMDFESSFANVKKTVEGTPEQFKALEMSFRQMAKEIPATTDELNAIAALGGQMGVPIDQLEKFTRHVAALGVAVDGISTEDAAAGLAQIGNIAGTGTSQIAEMASTLVHLGNSSNATEADILEFTKRLMGAGHAVGMTVQEVMALGTSMANVGINAEAGGTAMSTMIAKMSKAVSEGGAALEAFGAVSGLGAEKFAETWKRKPIEAIDAVVQGLSRAKASGIDLNLVVGKIGATNIRTADTMKRLAGAGDGVAVSLKTSNEGWINGNKHIEEAEKKYATTANQLKMLWSRIKDVGITLGHALVPAITFAISVADKLIPILDQMAHWFGALPGPVQATAVGLAGVAAAAGPLLVIFGQLAMSVSAVTGAFAAKGIATTVLATKAGGLAATLGILAAKAAAVVGVGFAGWNLGKWIGETTGLTNGVEYLTGKLMGLTDEQIAAGRASRLQAEAHAQQAEAAQQAGEATDIGAQMAKAMADAQKHATDATKGAASANKELDEWLKKSTGSTKESEKAKKAAEKASKELEAQLERERAALSGMGLVTERDVNEALEELATLQERATKEGVPMVAFMAAAEAKLKTLAQKAKDAGLSFDDLNDALAETSAELRKLQGAPPALDPKLFQQGAKMADLLASHMKPVTEETLRAGRQAIITGNAFKTLGIDTQDSLIQAARQARQSYEDIRRSGTATTEDLQRAREALLEAEERAGMRTVTIWSDLIRPGIMNAMQGIVGSVSNGITSMIGHWNRKKDAAVQIWEDIKSNILNVFNQILNAFINNLIGGMLNKLTGSKGQFGAAWSDALVPGFNAAWLGVLALAVPFVDDLVKIVWKGVKKIFGWFKDIFNFFGSAPRDSFDPEKPSGGGPDPFNPNNPRIDPDTGDTIPEFDEGQNVPNFNYGTHGTFPDFGDGTLAMLHGREAIVPWDERHALPSGGGGHLGTVILEMDGRQVARGVFPFIPDEAQRFQVGVR